MKANRYVPLEKRCKKEQRRHYAAARADWNGVVPVTRVIPNKKRQRPRQGNKLRGMAEEY